MSVKLSEIISLPMNYGFHEIVEIQ